MSWRWRLMMRWCCEAIALPQLHHDEWVEQKILDGGGSAKTIDISNTYDDFRDVITSHNFASFKFWISTWSETGQSCPLSGGPYMTPRTPSLSNRQHAPLPWRAKVLLAVGFFFFDFSPLSSSSSEATRTLAVHQQEAKHRSRMVVVNDHKKRILHKQSAFRALQRASPWWKSLDRSHYYHQLHFLLCR